MKIKKGKGISKYGKGILITLTGSEVATAISAYLYAHNIYTNGAITINVNGELIKNGTVYVDPSGFVIKKGVRYLGKTGKAE